MFLDRHGYLEETWFTFSLSPIRDERGQVAGLLLPVTETSARMLSERRVRALRDLSTRVNSARTVSETIVGTTEVLRQAALDVPLALLYLRDGDADHVRLRGSSGAQGPTAIQQAQLPLDGDSPVAMAMRDDVSLVIDDLVARYGPVHAGHHEESLQRALVVPITPVGAERSIGAMVLGISTRLPLDDLYRGFLDLVAQSVTGSLSSATAHEQDRARADGLAELDRAKSAFFSDLSHEFRTPLTLMLGPLEDELAERGGPTESNERLSMVQRNGIRLLRLVNSLLDFSRTESGRAKPTYQATDLAAFTVELAGLFEYAIEAAGLTFEISCGSLPEPVFVDREMWERIVLNLMSNAFKHTFEGGIAVTLSWRADHAELVVSDTGIGVSAEELPRLFERFHRVNDARSRTIEGTGIGLALVEELVARHGGQVSVESEPGVGTSFAVAIPAGRKHLPAELVGEFGEDASASSQAVAQAGETREWLTVNDGAVHDAGEASVPARVHDGLRPSVLLADDNADMLRHVSRLLEPNFDVVTAPDGVLALEAAFASPPDLVLTDVMMPRLDGFGLLAALRRDDRTCTIPVIMLSARAGEEASVEGVRAGVDDYVVKPFSGQELTARVSRSLEMARLRRESERRLEATNTELAQALAQLESIARADPGTGLPNRRAWDEELPREIERARRKSYPLCLALLDLDHLKAYNDTHGHQAGDTLLREAGAAWRTALRVTDVVARVGGDEFGVLMPDCELDHATEVLQRVRTATPYNATCSVGLACWDGVESSETLVGRADGALYSAKESGRGRTAVTETGARPGHDGRVPVPG
jgi:diguanylate cyclase (GGDEF)-like protein